MLENCAALQHCEKIILSALKGCSCIGEIDFSLADIDRLAALLKEAAAADADSGVHLLKNVPACVSVYLVGRGFTDYRDGDFWSAVLQEMGIAAADRYVIGDIFISFLKQHGLYRPQIKGAHAYVTPVLLHGGIPQFCCADFFAKVVKY